jgi:hypothetical protein
MHFESDTGLPVIDKQEELDMISQGLRVVLKTAPLPRDRSVLTTGNAHVFAQAIESSEYSSFTIDRNHRVVGFERNEYPYFRVKERDLPYMLAACQAVIDQAPRIRAKRQRRLARSLLNRISERQNLMTSIMD